LATPPKKTFWLNSKFPKHLLEKRLRENPFDAPKFGHGFNDLTTDPFLFHRGLITGSIIDLNQYLESNKKLLKIVTTGFGDGGVDLVSGGPPCQGFSMAGLRDHSNKRNRLPWEFARFVKLVQPKVALLENVTGILRAFNVEGKKIYPWFEIAKVFSSIGYVPICLHINAKYVGIAQNRPRFMMLAVRSDIYKKVISKIDKKNEKEIFENSLGFFNKIQNKGNVKYGILKCWDVEKHKDAFVDTMFSPLFKYSKGEWRTIEDAIDDLRRNSKTKISSYVKELNTCFNQKCDEEAVVENIELRRNSSIVRSRFHLYQLLSKVVPSVTKEVYSFLRNQEKPLTDFTATEMLKYTYRDCQTLESVSFDTKIQLEEFLTKLKTKKITQKALVPHNPAPAALTIPDDTCHYHHNELRTLTVREMARIQSFPDRFVFKSKVTTGGHMRKFEVPQYTQVGNAVPPLLGKAIGKVLLKLINLSQ